MDFLGIADPGVVAADAMTGLTFGIIRILGFGALGIVVFGFLLSGLCDLFECGKWRHAQGRTETRQMMH
ncbi:MAG: hypothetical protein WCC00_12015 [Candidatus Aminicenantales bacterium]